MDNIYCGIILILGIVIAILIFYLCKTVRQEVLLKQSEEMYKTIMNSLPDIICYKDAQGKWIVANDEMLKLYNTRIDIIGKTDSELRNLMPDYAEEFNACESTDSKVWENRCLTMVEESFRKPDGTKRTFDVAKVPLFYEDGTRKGLVVIGRDITERKRAEEMQQKVEENDRLMKEIKHYSEIRTEFFANLSHELRTPLNMILSPLQLIQNIIKNNTIGETSNKLQSYINIIKQNSYRLIRIVNNLIDITKIDAGYLELCLSNENIVEIVENITLSVCGYVEENNLTLIFDTDVEEKLISCDPDKIERIMLNLISNAIKFTPKGGKIEVSIKDGIEHIEIFVKDTGIGIPKEKRKVIFERFMQVDKSLSRNREGSGIGLSLVKAFVEMHGGEINIDSEYTDGCNFIIRLPVKLMSKTNFKPEEGELMREDNKVQVINIEFSDIYY